MMKFTMKRILLAFCVVLCLATAGWCIDPFKVNEGGFGPKIKGLQLGMKITSEEVGKRKNAGIDIERRSDGRIEKITFKKSVFGASSMGMQDFVNELARAYNIPYTMQHPNDDLWGCRDDDEGWLLAVSSSFEANRAYGDDIVTLHSVVIETAFD